MRRRLPTLTAPAATATLALLGTAWAATGQLPVVGGDPRAALAISAQSTGPLVANDREGEAILSAAALKPGVATTGEVTISNAGDAAGTFTLSSGGAADGPNAAGGLSRVLDLVVRDLTPGREGTVYAGKLSALDHLDLGTFAAGAARRYRFELTYPAGGDAASDNAYQGASTSVAFSWDAAPLPAAPAPTGDGSGAPVSPPVAVPAAPSAAAGRAAPAAPAPAGSRSAAPAATPGAPAAGRPALALGTARRPVAKGRLVTWMTSTPVTRARVIGTVTVSGRRYRLKPATVRLRPARRTVRLRLPRQAAGRGRRLTVRLTVTAGTGSARATLRRTLRVRGG